jgi:hypothetical protein
VRSGSYDWNLPREPARTVSGKGANGSQVQEDKGVKFIFKIREREKTPQRLLQQITPAAALLF